MTEAQIDELRKFLGHMLAWFELASLDSELAELDDLGSNIDKMWKSITGTEWETASEAVQSQFEEIVQEILGATLKDDFSVN